MLVKGATPDDVLVDHTIHYETRELGRLYVKSDIQIVRNRFCQDHIIYCRSCEKIDYPCHIKLSHVDKGALYVPYIEHWGIAKYLLSAS